MEGEKVAQGQEGLPRTSCASPFPGVEANREVEWTEHLNLLSLPSPPKEAASGGPGSSSITFFAFSLIEGYISIVMDAETQKKYVTPDPRWAIGPKPAPGREGVERQTPRSPG